MLQGVVLASLLTLCAIVLHMVLTHLLKPTKMFNLVSSIFAVGVPVYLLLCVSKSLKWVGLLNGLLVYILFFFNYVQCLYYISRPVTLRILIEFLNAPKHRLDFSALDKTYSLESMLQSRLNLLALHGYLQKKNEYYELTGKGNRFAALFSFLRQLFGIPYYLEGNLSLK